MKKAFECIAIVLLVLVIVWPWMIVVLDLVWWFFTGHATGLVQWTPIRAAFALWWPLCVGFLGMAAMGDM